MRVRAPGKISAQSPRVSQPSNAAGFDFSPPFRWRPGFVPFLRTNLISTLLSNARVTRINVPIVIFGALSLNS